jgi:tubulin polyglutamylase TTLL1/tubulin monoglycylase TTLL3/8
MRKKLKHLKKDSPSLLTYLSSQYANNSVDLGLPKGFRGSRLKVSYNQQYSFIASFDHQLKRGSLPFLKESLTVKKIEFSPPKKYEMPIILKPRANKPGSLETIESCKEIIKPRTESLPCSTIREKPAPDTDRKSSSQQPTPKILIDRKKDSPAVSKPAYSKISKPLPKMSLREAIRNTEWAIKARPELDRMWRKLLNRSNGVEIQQQGSVQYKYFIGKGNNSRLIRRLMVSRSWWVDVGNIEEAHFAWTQWKDKKLLAGFMCAEKSQIEKQETIQAPCICPVNVKIEKNQYRTVDIEDLGFQNIRNSPSYTALETSPVDPSSIKMHNKIEFNQHLTNKKGLYCSLKSYCEALDLDLFDFVPQTFHIKMGDKDPQFLKFVEEFQANNDPEKKKKIMNIWIIKPGENSNRGQGITVSSSLEEIKAIVNEKSTTKNNENRTYIIQKYIERPFLVHKRKFDFRCYGLITSINGVIQGYFYSEGYLRTTSCEYNIKDTSNNFIHLTNDAIQKHSEEYGKFEDGNKLSYKDFQRYLDHHYTERKVNFVQEILPKIKSLAKDSIMSAFLKLDPNRRLHCMEILGYDFMIDANLKPWLIEVNTNPCLELSSSYLSYLIPTMVDNALRIAIDPMFPPPCNKTSFESFSENRFELIFHQETDGLEFLERIGDRKSVIMETQEVSDKEELFSEDEV